MKSYFTLLISLVLITQAGLQKSVAQSYFSIGPTYAQPFDAFSFENYRPGGGFAMDFTSKEAIPRFLLNFQYGFHWDYIQSGTERFNSPFPFEEYKFHVTNQSSGGHMFLRATTIKAGIRFYGDVFAGSRLFFSTLTTYATNDWDSDRDDVDWLTSKLAGYYGAAGGVQIRVRPHVYLDTRVSQSFSTSARYVDLGSVSFDNGFLEYDNAYARNSDLLQVFVGLTFQIGEDERMKKKRKPKPQPQPQQPIDRPGPEPLPRS